MLGCLAILLLSILKQGVPGFHAKHAVFQRPDRKLEFFCCVSTLRQAMLLVLRVN